MITLSVCQYYNVTNYKSLCDTNTDTDTRAVCGFPYQGIPRNFANRCEAYRYGGHQIFKYGNCDMFSCLFSMPVNCTALALTQTPQTMCGFFDRYRRV